ncbi:inner membrane yabI domain protein, partial [Escherichia coli 97.0007]
EEREMTSPLSLVISAFAIGVVALVVLVRHPLMPVYIDILRKVVGV